MKRKSKLSNITGKTYSLSYSCTHRQLSTMSIHQMQKCKDYQEVIFWFSARNRADAESDVNLIVLENQKIFLKVSLVSVIRGSCYLTLSRTCGGLWTENIPDMYLARNGLGVGPCPS